MCELLRVMCMSCFKSGSVLHWYCMVACASDTGIEVLVLPAFLWFNQSDRHKF